MAIVATTAHKTDEHGAICTVDTPRTKLDIGGEKGEITR